jgi:hypothetical protein
MIAESDVPPFGISPLLQLLLSSLLRTWILHRDPLAKTLTPDPIM